MLQGKYYCLWDITLISGGPSLQRLLQKEYQKLKTLLGCNHWWIGFPLCWWEGASDFASINIHWVLLVACSHEADMAADCHWELSDRKRWEDQNVFLWRNTKWDHRIRRQACDGTDHQEGSGKIWQLDSACLEEEICRSVAGRLDNECLACCLLL